MSDLADLPAQAESSALPRFSLADLVPPAGKDCPPPEILRDLATIEAADTVARKRTYKDHNGATVSKEEAKALTITMLLMMGWSRRAIAKHVACSRHVIDHVMRRIGQSGRMAPAKERLLQGIGEMAEDAVAKTRELMDEEDEYDEEGKPIGPGMAARASMIKSLAVVAGIGADKLLGAAIQGDLHLHQHVHVEQGGLRDLLASRQSILSPDCASGGQAPKSLGANAPSAPAAGSAAVDVQATSLTDSAKDLKT